MNEEALGLIETRGFVGVVEAADAAVKAASVQLAAFEQSTGGLVTIKLVGDVAAVQSAVEAGANAAQRVGELVSKHVIPRPHEEVWEVLLTGEGTPKTKMSDRSADTAGADALESMSVVQLRRLARRTEGIGITGRQISRANKATLLRDIRSAQIQ